MHLGARLTGSVGKGGTNRPSDVLLIQNLLNRHLATPLRWLVVDAICGPLTIFAIEEIQRLLLGMKHPDGIVGPDSAALHALMALGAKPTPSSSDPHLMKISVTGLRLIEQSEGFRSTVYNDVAGNPTIGYGHLVLPGESFPNGITRAQAQAILANDVRTAEDAVQRLVTVVLTQNQFDALVDFVFNLGSGTLARSTLLRDLNADDYDGAADQFLRYDHAGGQVQPGLQARRQAEFDLFTAPAPSAG